MPLHSVISERVVLQELTYAVLKAKTVPFKRTRGDHANGFEVAFLQPVELKGFLKREVYNDFDCGWK